MAGPYPKAPDVDVGNLWPYEAIAQAWYLQSGELISRSRVQQICRKVEAQLREELKDLEADFEV